MKTTIITMLVTLTFYLVFFAFCYGKRHSRGPDNKQPVCPHQWSKWKTDGRRNMNGDDWLMRECSLCGWLEGAPSTNRVTQ